MVIFTLDWWGRRGGSMSTDAGAVGKKTKDRCGSRKGDDTNILEFLGNQCQAIQPPWRSDLGMTSLPTSQSPAGAQASVAPCGARLTRYGIQLKATVAGRQPHAPQPRSLSLDYGSGTSHALQWMGTRQIFQKEYADFVEIVVGTVHFLSKTDLYPSLPTCYVQRPAVASRSQSPAQARIETW